MGDRNEIKLIGVPDAIELRPDIGADDESVAFCFKKVDEVTFKARIPPEVIAIMLGAVRIVRCKNCRYYQKFKEGEGDNGYGWCDSHNICVHDYFFCAYGERREGGDT